MAEGTARSEGMFPRRAAWCDVETMIPDDGTCNKFPNMTSVRYSNGPRNREINFVAYFWRNLSQTLSQHGFGLWVDYFVFLNSIVWKKFFEASMQMLRLHN